ncbi:alpha-galactosidase, partial [[Ruminococcus] torques]
MSRQEVVDYLFGLMSHIIQDAKLDYIKWDMNRNITEMYGADLPADQQLEFSHRYILGVYDLYDRLTKAFPDVLFESCASGGGRFD